MFARFSLVYCCLRFGFIVGVLRFGFGFCLFV